jgi:hypothetical protein
MNKNIIIIIAVIMMSSLSAFSTGPPITFHLNVNCPEPAFYPESNTIYIGLITANGLPDYSISNTPSSFKLYAIGGGHTCTLTLTQWMTSVEEVPGAFVHLISDLSIIDNGGTRLFTGAAVYQGATFSVVPIGNGCNATAEIQVIANHAWADPTVAPVTALPFVYMLTITE